MKLLFTQQAIDSLNEALEFLGEKVTGTQIRKITEKIFDRCDQLVENPYSGQIESYLEHLGMSHRRIISGHYKIIYRVEEKAIFITDIFDSRQNPSKMKG